MRAGAVVPADVLYDRPPSTGLSTRGRVTWQLRREQLKLLREDIPPARREIVYIASEAIRQLVDATS
jgi:hypothetical protein